MPVINTLSLQEEVLTYNSLGHIRGHFMVSCADDVTKKNSWGPNWRHGHKLYGQSRAGICRKGTTLRKIFHVCTQQVILKRLHLQNKL